MCFFFNDSPTTEIYTLSLHDALPISSKSRAIVRLASRSTVVDDAVRSADMRSEEHTSELQSLRHLVCRLLLEKKNAGTRKQRHLERQAVRNARILPEEIVGNDAELKA